MEKAVWIELDPTNVGLDLQRSNGMHRIGVPEFYCNLKIKSMPRIRRDATKLGYDCDLRDFKIGDGDHNHNGKGSPTS